MAKRTSVGKRSPLKNKSLRLPGESIRDERERILDEQLMPLVLVSIFMVGLAILEWWRWTTKSPPQPVAVTFATVCMIGFTTYRLRKLLPKFHALNLGIEGERVVGQFLESERDSDWRIFHDVPGNGFNVDHIVLTSGGVFAVETKTFSKPLKGKATVSYDGLKTVVNGFEPDRDPVAQASAVRDWVRDLLLETTGMEYPVRGVVLFPGWYIDGPPKGVRPDVWVLNEKAFVKYLRNEPAVVKREDVALAASRLAQHTTGSRSA